MEEWQEGTAKKKQNVANVNHPTSTCWNMVVEASCCGDAVLGGVFLNNLSLQMLGAGRDPAHDTSSSNAHRLLKQAGTLLSAQGWIWLWGQRIKRAEYKSTSHFRVFICPEILISMEHFDVHAHNGGTPGSATLLWSHYWHYGAPNNLFLNFINN